MQEFRGKRNGDKVKIAIVVAEFNEFITKNLLEGALKACDIYQVEEENIQIVWVPGSFEIPLIAKKLAKSKQYDAIVCLGAVIRGETDHYTYVCSQTASGIMSASLETEIPILFGVLTLENKEQGLERLGIKGSNKGFDAVQAAIEMANLSKELENKKEKKQEKISPTRTIPTSLSIQSSAFGKV